MVVMACETRRRPCGEPFPSDCHPVGRRPRQCRRRAGEGPAGHNVVGRYYDPTTGQFLSVDPEVQQTREAFQYADDDPVSTTDPSGLCWSVAPGAFGPCPMPPPGVPYNGSFTLDEIAEYPQVLKGLNPDDVMQLLGPEGIPSDAYVGPAHSGSLGEGPGWKIELKSRGNITIRWSPGSAREDHPDTPYWKVASGKYGAKEGERIPAGQWEDRPAEYRGPRTGTSGIGGGDDESGTEPCLTSFRSSRSVKGGAVLLSCGADDFGGFGGDPWGDDDPVVELD